MHLMRILFAGIRIRTRNYLIRFLFATAAPSLMA